MRFLCLLFAGALSLGAGESRIASFSPGATRTLLDLGCASELVMATRWCPLPAGHPAAREADVFMPDLERLLKVRPSLVILPRMANPLWAEKCAKAGLRVIVLHPESGDSTSKDIERLGEAVDRAPAAARITAPLRARPRQPDWKVVIVWDGVMAGPGSYLAEPLAAAGMRSALTQGAWVKFDWELLASTRPDAVLFILNSVDDGPIGFYPEKDAQMRQIPVIKELSCLKSGHIYQVPSGGNWLPGSGLIRVIADLKALRPPGGR